MPTSWYALGSLPSLSFGIPLRAGQGGIPFGFPVSGEAGRRASPVPHAPGVSLWFPAGGQGGEWHRESRCWACTHSYSLGPSPHCFPSLVSTPPTHPTANGDMPPNKSICPLAKVPAASPWGIVGLGRVPTILWREIRSVCQGWGPRLLTSLRVLGAADLGSSQPQVSVSALSSELL